MALLNGIDAKFSLRVPCDTYMIYRNDGRASSIGGHRQKIAIGHAITIAIDMISDVTSNGSNGRDRPLLCLQGRPI